MRRRTRRRLVCGLGILFFNCVKMAFAQCNGTAQQITAIEPVKGVITSPGFPKHYVPDLYCVFKLSAPLNAGLVIQLSLLELDLLEPYSDSAQCLRDYLLLIIIDKVGREHVSQRYCGKLDASSLPVLKTLQSQAKVVFVSTDAAVGRYRGFSLRYEFAREVDIRAPISLYDDPNERYRPECGGSTEPYEISGEIKSPGFPYTYPRNVTCNWLIRVAEGKQIYLRLIHLQLSTTFAECSRACLYIIDGFKHEPIYGYQSGNMPGETRFCGSHLYYNEEGMKSYLSNNNRVIIRFVTTDYPSTEQQKARQIDGTAIGFKILWTEVNSLVTTDELHEVDCGVGFTCKGEEFCLDNGQNVCAERLRLCINETLKCDGVSNCAENDNSDEEFCYPKEFFIYVSVGTASLIILCACGCLLCCFLRLCRSNGRSTSASNHKKASNNKRRQQTLKSSEREFMRAQKHPVPQASVTTVNSTKQRDLKKLKQSNLSNSNSSPNDTNPIWQLNPNNSFTLVRFNHLQRAQV